MTDVDTGTGDRAAQPRGPGGIDADLDLVAAQVEALHELAEDPEASQHSGRVYSLSINWGVMLGGRLERLRHYHRHGELTAAEEERYQQLCAQLRDAMPLIEHFDLARPRLDEADDPS